MATDFPSNPTVGQVFTDPTTGISYVWNGYGWTVQGGGGAVDAYTKAESDAKFVKIPGDEMTGALSIKDICVVKGADPHIIAEKAASGGQSVFSGNVTGAGARWSMAMGNAEPETGANAGSNFSIQRYSDTGVHLGEVLKIDRNTGSAGFGGPVGISQPTGSIYFADAVASLTSLGGNAGINLAKSSGATGYCQINAYVAGASSPRWSLNLAVGAEGGGNSGSDLSFGRFADDGTPLLPSITCTRSSGLTRIGAGMYLAGDLTFDQTFLWWINNGVNRVALQATDTAWNFFSNATLTVGQSLASGASAWTSFSDARMPWKVSATPVSVLDKLGGVALYGNIGPSGKPELFFKAQELAATLPELVYEPTGPETRNTSYVPTGMADVNAWGVTYDRSGAVALQAVKELLGVIDELKARIDALERPTPTGTSKKKG